MTDHQTSSLLNGFFQAISSVRNTSVIRQARQFANQNFNLQSFVAILLLSLISLSSLALPVQAQVSYTSKKQHSVVSDVKIILSDVQVAANGQSNLIQWQTDVELNILGFHLYREENGAKVPVNSQLIPASTFMVGADVELKEGHRYEYRDTANGAATYWIEALDVQGNSTWQGPFAVNGNSAMTCSPEDENLAVVNEPANPTVPVEPRARLSNASRANARPQSSTATDGGWKFDVQQEGWYVITRQELLAAGFEQNVNPRLLQLFVDDQQQPIYVKGQEDGKLDATDTIEFYGQGIDSPFCKARKYWLTKGRGVGLRTASAPAAAALTVGGNFTYSVERKDRTIYFSSLLNGETENFFGAVISRNPVNQTLTIQHPDLSAVQTATLKVKLQGVNWVSHIVDVAINDMFLGQVSFEYLNSGEAAFTFPHSLLREGDNKVTLTPRGGNSDISLVDALTLTYQHTFVADNNYLRVNANGGQQFTIWGFTQDAIEVYDVTNPAAVQNLKGQIQKRETAAGVEFGVSVILGADKNPHQLLALTRDRVRSVANLCLDTPSSLRNTNQGADLVIITSKDFFNAIEPLKALRQRQGLTVKVVDVEDIYDEFCFGQKTPMAVKDFLNYASRNWKKPVRYALFFGDATYDPKMFLNGSGCDVVPTKLVDTMFMETASDDWMTDFNEDGIADVAIGRLPARNVDQANVMVGKLLTYEQVKPSNDVLMVSDINDVYDFENANNALVPYLPEGTNVNYVKRSQMSDADARTQIRERLNQGTRIVNYNGHGSVNLWRGNLLTATGALGLQNNQSLPMFVIMNCLNGYYQDPNLEGLAESLLKAPQGGAVAAWASSGLTFADGQSAINQEFYRLLFGGQAQGLTIGEAAMRAKASTTDPDIRRSWVLFGDPSMRFH